MRLVTILLYVTGNLCAIERALGAESNILRIEVTPLIEEASTLSMAGCVNSSDLAFEGASQHPTLWPLLGPRLFGSRVYESYKELEEKALGLGTSSISAPVTQQGTAQNAPWQKFVDAISRAMSFHNSTSLSDAVCATLSAATPTESCNYTDVALLTTSCFDQLAASLNQKEMCTASVSAIRKCQMSSMCSGWVAGVVESLNIGLYVLNDDGGMAGTVNPKVAAQEARAYYVGWKAAERLAAWTDAHLFCSNQEPVLRDLEVLPSWKSKAYVFIRDKRGVSIPLAVLAKRDTTNLSALPNLLLVIRDARTTFEARLQNTNQLARQFLHTQRGPIHEGFDAVASQLLSALQPIIHDILSEGDALNPRITVVGRGVLGSGVGAIVARDLANLSFNSTKKSERLDVNLIAFGRAMPGGSEFMEDLASKVNVRNILTSIDGLSSPLCAYVKGCPIGAQIATGSLGELIGPFRPLPGRVSVDVTKLNPLFWKSSTARFQIGALEGCAVPCWLAENFCSDDQSAPCSSQKCGVCI